MRIGELARRTGVGVSALRAWERRHQLLLPERSEAGHRLYGEGDVERVRAVVRLVEEGLNLSAAVARVQAVGPAALPHGEGEDRLHGQILERAGIGIWVARFGRTRYANPWFADLVGMALDALVQLPVTELFAPGELERLAWSTERVRAGGSTSVTARLRRADGSTFLARMENHPLLGPTGSYEGAVAVVDDHTDAAAREELLALQSSLLDALPDATVITRPDLTVLHVNAAAERTFGHRLAEVVGRDAREALYAPETIARTADITRSVVAGRRYAGRLRIVRQDGSDFLAHSAARLVETGDGEPVGIVTVIQDLSEHDRVRRELRNREVQAEALAVLGAHALRAGADPALVAEVVVEAVDTARRLVRADHATAFLVEPGGDGIEVHPALPPLGPHAAVEQTVAALTRRARQPVVVRDTSIDPRFPAAEACSAIGVPVGGPRGLTGALVVVGGAADRVDAASVHFLQSIANQVGELLLR